MDEVAGRCGFRSPVALRGHFRRQLGSSPASYRAAYRARRPQPEPSAGPVAVPMPAPVPETVLPQALPQARRTAAASAVVGPGATSHTAAEPGKPSSDLYASGYTGGRPSLPGQRSAP